MVVLKAGTVYFALVFATGFVLGSIRELWAVPRFGTRAAELSEMPLMLGAMVLVARWTVRRFCVPARPSARLTMGLSALGLLLVAELTLVLRVRGLSLAQYVAGRDPVSGTVYLVMLAVFVVVPALVGHRMKRGDRAP